VTLPSALTSSSPPLRHYFRDPQKKFENHNNIYYRCSPATAASTCHPLAAVMTNAGSIFGLIECIVEEEQGQLISTEELEGMIISVDKAKSVTQHQTDF
jgi:hypothetical protein